MLPCAIKPGAHEALDQEFDRRQATGVRHSNCRAQTDEAAPSCRDFPL
jgi:hypothetical protein